MRKALLIFMLSAAMCGVTTVAQAARVRVDVGVHFGDPNQDLPVRRTPTLLPEIYIDGNILSFDELCGEFLLEVIQDDTVVYSTIITDGMTSVDLPSSLSGSFEIRFETDTYYYYGYIEL